MHIKRFFLLFTFIFVTDFLVAQDAQPSQYYASSLYLNPAFAGTTHDSRISLSHRRQWPNLDASFNTYIFSFDRNLEKIRSGVGLTVFTDFIPESRLRATDIQASYSYRVDFNKEWHYRPSVQVGLGIRSIDYSTLLFGDQFTNQGLENNLTIEELGNNNRIYPDISTGHLIFSRRFYAGVAAHHLNRPNLAFNDGNSRLPIRWTVHGGYHLPLKRYKLGQRSRAWSEDESEEISLLPSFLYRHQGAFDQLDIGTYFVYHGLVTGVWYRGIPVKTVNRSISNNESLVFLLGFHKNHWKIGYSYDLNISSLNGSGGAHELTFVCEIYDLLVIEKKKYNTDLPCPKF